MKEDFPPLGDGDLACARLLADDPRPLYLRA
jgi:hypothetical protein